MSDDPKFKLIIWTSLERSQCHVIDGLSAVAVTAIAFDAITRDKAQKVQIEPVNVV